VEGFRAGDLVRQESDKECTPEMKKGGFYYLYDVGGDAYKIISIYKCFSFSANCCKYHYNCCGLQIRLERDNNVLCVAGKLCAVRFEMARNWREIWG
jgi:hypothetical protein